MYLPLWSTTADYKSRHFSSDQNITVILTNTVLNLTIWTRRGGGGREGGRGGRLSKLWELKKHTHTQIGSAWRIQRRFVCLSKTCEVAYLRNLTTRNQSTYTGLNGWWLDLTSPNKSRTKLTVKWKRTWILKQRRIDVCVKRKNEECRETDGGLTIYKKNKLA